jgi:hypothetical protein
VKKTQSPFEPGFNIRTYVAPKYKIHYHSCPMVSSFSTSTFLILRCDGYNAKSRTQAVRTELYAVERRRLPIRYFYDRKLRHSSAYTSTVCDGAEAARAKRPDRRQAMREQEYIYTLELTANSAGNSRGDAFIKPTFARVGRESRWQMEDGSCVPSTGTSDLEPFALPNKYRHVQIALRWRGKSLDQRQSLKL